LLEKDIREFEVAVVKSEVANRQKRIAGRREKKLAAYRTIMLDICALSWRRPIRKNGQGDESASSLHDRPSDRGLRRGFNIQRMASVASWLNTRRDVDCQKDGVVKAEANYGTSQVRQTIRSRLINAEKAREVFRGTHGGYCEEGNGEKNSVGFCNISTGKNTCKERVPYKSKEK
jgi:hypothetical protein